MILVDNEYKQMNKNIKRNKQFKIDKNLKAAYIGSNPILNNVIHIAEIVSADYYILCDLDFKEEKEFKFDNCVVQITPRKGEDLSYTEIGFVLLDQAVTGYEKIIKKLKRGTYLFFWCLDVEDLEEFGFKQKFIALGLKQIKICLFIKE